MRKTILLLLLVLGSEVYADSVLLQYEPGVTREEIESKLTSFGLVVGSYWEFIHGGHILVPCREAERWVRVLREVKGISGAEHNRVVSGLSDASPAIPVCVPETEPAYDDELEIVVIPQLHLDGSVYYVKLVPPFNIQELELLGVLSAYEYEE